MSKNNYQVTIIILIISTLHFTCNEAKQISREKLARLLGQNPAVGFRHEKNTHKKKSSPGKPQNQKFAIVENVQIFFYIIFFHSIDIFFKY